MELRRGVVVIIDGLRSPAPLTIQQLFEVTGSILAVGFTSGNARIYAVIQLDERTSRLEVWDVSSKRVVHTISLPEAGFGRPNSCGALDQIREKIASEMRPALTSGCEIETTAASRDGRWLAATRWVHQPERWNLVTGKSNPLPSTIDGRAPLALSPYEHEFRRRMAATGEVRWFHSRSMPRRREDGAVMWDGVEFDITEQKHAAEARQQSEALLQAITDHSEDMIFVKDRDLRLLFLNPAGCRLHGLAAGQLLGRTDAQIHPDAAQATAFAEVDRRVMESRRTEIFEEEFTTPDGEKKTLLTAKTPRLDEHGHVVGIIGIARDITERKRAEEQLKVSLHEKEVLLREVHHRVKNNLQIVSSLLNLQSRTLTDPALLQVFASTRDRVRAMAAVHERLYESGDFAQIDLAAHLGKLARTLTLAHAPTGMTVQPVLQLESVTVDLNTAVPLSLIASELITNALKYGFAGGRTGTLTIGLRAAGGHHELRIGDDGPGFPAAVDPATSRTLGLRLVRDLSRQIRAELEIDSTAAGTNVVIRWPARLAATEPVAPPSQNDAVGAVPLSTQRRGDAEGAETLHPGIGPQKG